MSISFILPGTCTKSKQLNKRKKTNTWNKGKKVRKCYGFKVDKREYALEVPAETISSL